jgi:hypothetical protein
MATTLRNKKGKVKARMHLSFFFLYIYKKANGIMKEQ